ncbi:MAG: M48 family metalloprotease, partial [Pseudomonadota bacterium]
MSTCSTYKNLLIFLFALSLAAVCANLAASDLPELGDPASQTMSPQQEREIGQRFFRQAQASNRYVHDALLEHYFQNLGERLVNSNQLADQHFRFFLLNNPTINAFAVPGGYIGFYSGLVAMTETEGQLASVLAHEIAHVSQRHLARIFARQEKVSLATWGAILAGIIAASQGAGQVGNAAIFSGVATNAQSQVDFTREHELEADRIGVRMLKASG